MTAPYAAAFDRLATLAHNIDAKDFIDAANHACGTGLVMSTSFGIHSAALLHLATQVIPRLPVFWIDTGYLPAETYRFADMLTTRLDLNLHVHQAAISPARMEALYGRFWENPRLETANHYDEMRKIAPMHKALADFGATGWIAGVRRSQTEQRAGLQRVVRKAGLVKLHPILNWSVNDLDRYLKRHGLPYHPLHRQGYRSVGDWHSSRPMDATDATARSTRFHGLKTECGLHT